MKTRRKGNILTILVILFVCISFLVPGILLSLQEKQLEEQVFTRAKKESKLDVEAEKIYLVKAIHDIEEGSNLITVENWHKVYTTAKNTKEEFRLTEIGKQIEKLENLQILQDTGIDRPTQYSVHSNTTGYQDKEGQYFLGNIQVEIEQDRYEGVMESKTCKFLSLAFQKEKLYEGRSKKEILESFIQYLDLYIIDDWEYKEVLRLEIWDGRNEIRKGKFSNHFM